MSDEEKDMRALQSEVGGEGDVGAVGGERHYEHVRSLSIRMTQSTSSAGRASVVDRKRLLENRVRRLVPRAYMSLLS